LSKVTKLCFVCTGNIIRSPLAENIFRHLVAQAGLDGKYQVESAGTSTFHIGEPPDSRMRRVAASHGFRYTGKARQFTLRDFDENDVIIAMDASNRTTLLRIAWTPEQQAKVHLLRAFDPQAEPNNSVPDPYYGGIEGFEEVYQIVERSCRGLLQALENGELVPSGNILARSEQQADRKPG
jgi:protein-tyrosine phosphatase